jgi:hypothetical protein
MEVLAASGDRVPGEGVRRWRSILFWKAAAERWQRPRGISAASGIGSYLCYFLSIRVWPGLSRSAPDVGFLIS